MLVAGIRRTRGEVGIIRVPPPGPLAGDEVLIQVKAEGVGNWDDIARTGGWDVGRRPPMALGVEAAGVVTAVGSMVTDWAPGDEVMTHPLPLRHPGTWPPTLIAPATVLARRGPCDHGLERLCETGRRPAERPRTAARGRTARDPSRNELRATRRRRCACDSGQRACRRGDHAHAVEPRDHHTCLAP